MVRGSSEAPDPNMLRAQRIFYAPYGLPEFANPVSRLAATEFLGASRAGRVPDWVVGLAELREIRDAAKG